MPNNSRVIDRVIFLDLDGVLFDTLKEAYCVGMLTATNRRSLVGTDFKSEHFKIFKRHRPLIKCAADYYDLLKSILSTDNFNFSNKQAFEKRFFRTRRYLRRRYPKYWFSLNAPYKFLYKISQIIREARKNFFIITTKDKGTVLELLKRHKINFCGDNIYDGQYYKRFASKGRLIKSIIDKYRVRNAIMIDDSRQHLSSCTGIKGLTRIHAKWGYTSPDDNSKSAREAIYKIQKMLGAKNVRTGK